MAYALDPRRRVNDEVRRVAVECADEALVELDSVAAGTAPCRTDAVHEIRKRCKELRAIVRMLADHLPKAGRPLDKRIRDVARSLSPARDDDVARAVLEDLHETLRSGTSTLADDDDAPAAALAPPIPFQTVRTGLVDIRADVAAWELPKGFGALREGLELTYRAGRQRWRTARRAPSDARVHEWRKSVKYLWYQLRLLEPASPRMLGPLVATLDELAEELGRDHDLAIAIERLAHRHDAASTAAVQLARGRQDALRGRAFRLGDAVYAERPAAFGRRVGHYWQAAVRRGAEPAHG